MGASKEWYSQKDLSHLLPLVKGRYSKTDVDRFLKFWNEYNTYAADDKNYRASHHFIPIGLHNIWLYHDKEFLLGLADPIKNYCSHFRHVLPMQRLPEKMRLKAYKFGVRFHD